MSAERTLVASTHLDVTARRVRDVVTLRLSGELDVSDADGVRGALRSLLDEPGVTVMLDLRHLAFIDIAGSDALQPDDGCVARVVLLGEPGPAFDPFRRAGLAHPLGHLRRVGGAAAHDRSRRARPSGTPVAI